MNKPKIYITHSTAFDFKTNLYAPLKASTLNEKYQLIFPHDNSIQPINSKEIIKASTVILAEVTYPSTGQGIELGWAEVFGKPILCIYQNEKIYSKSLSILTNNFFSYQNTIDLIKNLEFHLKNIIKLHSQAAKSSLVKHIRKE